MFLTLFPFSVPPWSSQPNGKEKKETLELTFYVSFRYILLTSCSFLYKKCQRKKKNLPTSLGFSPNVYKIILTAEARISTTSTPRSYISAMILVLNSLLFFCLDIFEP